MHKITPNLEEIEKYAAIAPEGPIVIVNLLKFNGKEGAELFKEYLQLSQTIFDAETIGVQMIYVGVNGPDFSGGEDWDLTGIVHYDSYDEFLRIMRHPEYQAKATPMRDKAVSKAILMVSKAIDGPDWTVD